MNLLHNDLESLLTPGTIVAHYKRDRYLKVHKNDENFDDFLNNFDDFSNIFKMQYEYTGIK